LTDKTRRLPGLARKKGSAFVERRPACQERKIFLTRKKGGGGSPLFPSEGAGNTKQLRGGDIQAVLLLFPRYQKKGGGKILEHVKKGVRRMGRGIISKKREERRIQKVSK